MQETSAIANDQMEVSGSKINLKERIYSSMLKKGGGNYEKIAADAGLRDAQVWKRLSEMVVDKKIRDTGKTSALSSGKQGIVWAICVVVDENKQPKESHYTQQGKLFL